MPSSQVVQTVLGPIAPADLGVTQIHEHLFVDFVSGLRGTNPAVGNERWDEPVTLGNYYDVRRHKNLFRQNRMLTSVEDAIDEVAHFRRAGGGCLVDVTSGGIGRNPEALRQVSEAAGVKVVMGCGYYVHDYHPVEVDDMTADGVRDEIVHDLMTGVGQSSVRAGIIGEIGLSWPLHPAEETVLAGAVKAQQMTGAALSIHPGRSPLAPRDAVQRIERMGGDLSRVVVGHVDRTIFQIEDFVGLARTGCYLEFDLFGQESSYYELAPIDMPNDATRVDILEALGARGYWSKLLISQDICLKAHLKRYGGEGYDHILQRVLPLMDRRGISAEQVNELTVSNPARALAFVPPQ